MAVTGIDKVTANFGVWLQVARVRTLAASGEIAIVLEAYAKAHHPFQNRTGDTERTTTATVQEIDGMVQIILFSKTPYAQYLELTRGGKWAWLRDAVTANRDVINRILAHYWGVSNAYDGTFTVEAQDKRLHP